MKKLADFICYRLNTAQNVKPINLRCALGVRPVRAFADNYIWLIEAPRAARTASSRSIPAKRAPVEAELDSAAAQA